MTTSSPLPQWLDPSVPKQIKDQTDRGAAIIGGSLVEHNLEKLLQARMRPDLSKNWKEELFEGRGALADFAPKIEVAFAFGLFGPETRNDLLQICGIRNKFAHEFEGPERTFDHRVIKAKIDAMGYIKRIAPPSSSDIQPPVDIRGKFIGGIYFYSAQLYGELLTNPQIPFTPKYLP